MMHHTDQPDGPPIVDVAGLSYVRRGKSILHGIDWRIARGEHWALLGANGSGKTTLLKIITGYEWPTRGTVRVLGRRYGACDIRDMRKHIGWVSSALEHRLPGAQPCLEVVVSGLDAAIGLYRRPEQAERDAAGRALHTMGVEGLAKRPYGVLSQGEKQRVLIARALIAEPGLLILDEPCAGLDPAAREHFLNDLAGMAQRPDGPTILFVTHHIEEIGPWIGQVVVLKEGCVFKTGRTRSTLTDMVMSDVFSHPCRVERSNGRFWLRAGSPPSPGNS